MRVGLPKIAVFNLTSSLLPPPASLAGNQHQCVLALIHHADDQFTNTQTNVDLMTSSDRKAAHKNLTVVQFTGTVPPEMPIVMPFRIHNANLEELLFTSFIVTLNGYPGRVRMLIPALKTEGELEDVMRGMFLSQEVDDIQRWADTHIAMIKRNQRSKHRYDKFWSRQRIEDIRLALETGTLLEVEDKKQVALTRIVMEPDTYHTVFLIFDRPPEGEIGQAFELDIHQLDMRREALIGGLSARIELVPDPQR